MTDLLTKYAAELDKTIEHSIGIERLKGAKILVVGATGTIGSWITATFLRYNDTSNAGIMVSGTSRTPLLQDFSGRNDFIWLKYDLLSDIGFSDDFDYIIHAAGNAYPAMFYEKPVETSAGTVVGTDRLLAYGMKHGVTRFLFVSSGEVYGEVGPGVETLTEDVIGTVDTLSPRSSYPLAKRMAENLCVSYQKEFGVDTVIARCCHTFGPVITAKDNRAHSQFILKARSGEDIVLNSDGENRRSYLYVADCVSGLLTILINGKSAEVYNVCDRACVASIRELAQMAARASGTNVVFDIKDDLTRNATPIKRQIMNDMKLKGLGWSAEYSIEDGIRSAIQSEGE